MELSGVANTQVLISMGAKRLDIDGVNQRVTNLSKLK